MLEHSGLWVGPPQYPPHIWTAVAFEVVGPADPKLQDLHDTRQQQYIQEESQRGPSVECVAEAKGLEPEWIIAMKTYK